MANNLSTADEIPSQVSNKPWVYAHHSRSDRKEINMEKIGKWMLFFDDDNTGDQYWKEIKNLVQKNTLFSAKCSTKFKDSDYSSKSGVVICYTSDFENRKDVKNAADAIRDSINYKPDMYYKTDNATRAGIYRKKGYNLVSIYKHDFKKKFYERDEEGAWEPVDIEDIEEEPVRKKHKAENLSPSTENDAFKRISGEDSSLTIMNLNEEISDEWIIIRSQEMINYDKEKLGKWMLFFDNTTEGLCNRDKNWILIKKLVDEGTLLYAQCSNGRGSGYMYFKRNSVILCYTSDFKNKSEVKLAADVIRDVLVDYKKDIYYKTEKASEAEKTGEPYDGFVSIYKHTSQKQFFERDLNGSWSQVL